MFADELHRLRSMVIRHKGSVVSLGALLITLPLWSAITWMVNWIGPSNAAERIDVVTGAAQIIGGFALLLGLFFTHKSLQNSRRGVVLAQETLSLSQRSQDTDRFFRAVEQLGNTSSIDVRVGAVYALGALADDSEQHYKQVIEVIVHFLRRRTDSRTLTLPLEERILSGRGDVQAAISTLARRRAFGPNKVRDALNLSGLVLEGYDFHGGWFESCDFTGSALRNSDFSGAILHYARFANSDCQSCQFDGAGLISTRFVGTDLSGATFHDPLNHYPLETSMMMKIIAEQNPHHRLASFLSDRDYDEVNQRLGEEGHRLRGALFFGANLRTTSFYNANLTETYGLTQEQVAEARTDAQTTLLPDPLPHQAEADAI